MTIEKLANLIKIKTKTSLVTLSNKGAKIGELEILTPGEYEKDGVFMEFRSVNLLWLFADKLHLAWVGGGEIKPKYLEDLGGVDILLVEDDSLVREIEPKLAIITSKLKEKLTIKDSDLPMDGTKILP